MRSKVACIYFELTATIMGLLEISNNRLPYYVFPSKIVTADAQLLLHLAILRLKGASFVIHIEGAIYHQDVVCVCLMN